MTMLSLRKSVKTGLLTSGWYAKRLGRDMFPGVLGLCDHGIRTSRADRESPLANLHVLAETFEPPLERSRFVVLAEVTAAELAHSIAYARPR